jgi:hypothetical protein
VLLGAGVLTSSCGDVAGTEVEATGAAGFVVPVAVLEPVGPLPRGWNERGWS